MSFTYQVTQMNSSLEDMVKYFDEYMTRTEQAFQAMHQRLIYLERRLDTSDRSALSDAQVERVLRKIMAEKFAMEGNPTPHSEVSEFMHPQDGPDPRFHQLPARRPEGGSFIMKDDLIVPKRVDVDLKKLLVDPEAMPTPAFGRDMERLQHNIRDFPQLDPNKRPKAGKLQPSGRNSERNSDGYSPPNKRHSNNAWS
jgi:hypothetical protein